MSVKELEIVDAAAARGPFLTVDGVVERYAGAWSAYQIRAHAKAGLLPHMKLPGRRDLLFPVADLERYEAGEVEMETKKLPAGGRIVRPRAR